MQTDDPDQPDDTPPNDPYARIRALYAQVTGGKYQPTDKEVSQWGTNIDANYLSKIQQAIGSWWTNYNTSQPTTTSTTTPTTSPSVTTPQPQSLLDFANIGGPNTLTAPFTGTFNAPNTSVGSWWEDIPELNLPTFKQADPFAPTTAADVTKDPGYAFLLGEGQRGVAQSAAARGLTNSGGTLKDIAKWTEDYAGTRFNDVDQRRRNDYSINYQTQTLDPYKYAYQSALDAYAPKLTAWTTKASANQRAGELNYSNAWQQFLQQYNQFVDQRDSTWNKVSSVLTA